MLAFFLAFISFIGCKYNKALEKTTPTDNSKYSGEAFKDHIRPTEARTPEDERLGFKLPEGFEISLYASEPDIGKPINIAFDARGRMWVNQSFEYPFAAAPGTGKDRLTIIEDTNNDGKGDRFVHFNDTLNIPIGILPVSDGAVAYSIPNVYRFTDKNGDGVVDSQKKFLGPFEYKDTHGMVNNFIRGYDGWIHGCHGYSNRSVVAGADGDSIRLISGNTFRLKPDGSHVEKTTDGRINPFGLAWDELGYLYSTDCHTSPLYQLIRGGDYTQWGKEETMGFAPEMKPFDNEATALAGIAYYADVHFPKAFQKNFYIGDPVSSRVYRNSFTFKGATPVGNKEPDFILSEDPWFRPVDVKMGPDGALYVADFYNSIIGHYEVPLNHPKRDRIRGRIWRITYKGKTNKPKSWSSAAVDELLAALDMNNMPVRMFAADELADRIGRPAVAPLKILLEKRISGQKYIHAMWVLQRLNALDADMIKKAAAHKDPLIRVHTMRILREHPDKAQTFHGVVMNALNDGDVHVKRAAVELLTHYPEINAVKSVLAIRAKVPEYDSHLLYTTRLVTRNLVRNQELMRQVAATSWSAEESKFLADVMVDVPSAASASFLAGFLKDNSLPVKTLPISFQHIARFIPNDQMNRVITTAIEKKGDNLESEYLIFKAIQRGLAQKGRKENELMNEWGKTLAQSLFGRYPLTTATAASNDARRLMREQQNFAIELAGDYKIRALEPQLKALLQNATPASAANSADMIRENLQLKTAAIKALLKINPVENVPIAANILQDEAMPIDFRKQVAIVLGDFPGAVANQALANVKQAPQDLQTAIVMSLANTREGKNIIFQQVRNGNLFARTLLDSKVEERIQLGITPKQKAEYEELIANLEPVSKEKEALILSRLKQFAASKQTTTIDSGRNIFLQHCASCHKIGNQGGMIGPNLDGVNKWGPQALAEKILDPNRNISENFRTYTIKLKDGKVLTGLFRREAGEVIVFADIAGQEFSVPKKDIEERKASKYTLMPDHFGTILSQNQFNTLLNYLLNLKS